MIEFDYIIVGSGIAGLYTAMLAQERNSVLVLTKGSIEECNTRFAQGGIAAAIGGDDSPDLHQADTLTAGAGLSDLGAVSILAQEASDRIRDLIEMGVSFDTVEGAIALAREAAHSRHRILHAGGDATGAHIEQALSGAVRLTRVAIFEHTLATQVLVEDGAAQGVLALDTRTGAVEGIKGKFIILATGGAGQLYRYNTNSPVATGDGVALAYRAGAEIADMEFFQFHPTALRLPGVHPFLISEAVRGEGGILRNARGQAFMKSYAPQGDLATRDVVARSIMAEMRQDGSDHVYLDVTHLPASTVTTRFPQIYRFCRSHGLDITRQPIPVAPAAHYMMGGVRANSWGETNIPHLFVAGETACTGVHGANRLASNSLLETIIFSKRIISKTAAGNASPRPLTPEAIPLPERHPAKRLLPLSLPSLQALMWDKVGMVRTRAGLEEAADTLAGWEMARRKPADRASWELANLALTGRLVAEAALLREESRGAHYRSDFPQPSPEWQRHIVFRTGATG
ncbi:MAG: L-aspartate oxidase [Chloroflexi bacterium]|nr:L-aspartate oxidase [Chloroflexota bacterium]